MDQDSQHRVHRIIWPLGRVGFDTARQSYQPHFFAGFRSLGAEEWSLALDLISLRPIQQLG